jgi:hypothetical protein
MFAQDYLRERRADLIREIAEEYEYDREEMDGSGRPRPSLSVVPSALLNRGSRKDPEKYQRPRAVPAIPIDKEEAPEGRAVGGWVACADRRGYSNLRYDRAYIRHHRDEKQSPAQLCFKLH